MIRLPAIWLLCFGLVLTRLLGMHAHACAGFDTASQSHEAPHYADAGILFGESHADDHSDNLEIKLAAVPAAKFKRELDLGDHEVPVSSDLITITAPGWMTVRAPRGPPEVRESRPDYFVPPLRGPPSYSLA